MLGLITNHIIKQNLHYKPGSLHIFSASFFKRSSSQSSIIVSSLSKLSVSFCIPERRKYAAFSAGVGLDSTCHQEVGQPSKALP